MTFVRSVLVGLCAAALLGVPTAATATSPSALEPRTSVASSRYDTSIRFLNFDSVRGYLSDTTIRGQVAAAVNNSQGAVRGVRVKLYRKINGTTQWNYLQTRSTTQSDYPSFTFVAKSVANARYQVRYAGNTNLQPSRARTTVLVYRHFHASLEDGTGRFHGRVSPDYGSRRVNLQKRSCAACGWHRVQSSQTGDRGGYSFTVGAPRNGRSFWRVSTPASTKYIRSSSGVFTTRRG